jgi:DNA-binding response OmpR family regulator
MDGWQPALIVLDVMLSGEDGRDAVRRLKGSKRHHRVPIMLMSADPSARYDGLVAGADAFLAKPFDMTVILHEVSRLTATQKGHPHGVDGQ